MWELPLHRLYQYYHTALRSNDVWTVVAMPNDKKTSSKVNDALDAVAKLAQADMEDFYDEDYD